MMKRVILLVVSCLFLVACDSNVNSSTNTHTIIDWVDFLKIDDVQYEAVYSGVIADPSHIGEVIGEVKFKMDEHITNSSYKAKNGDASYLEIGTEIFAVETMPSIVAVKDEDEINNYRLYDAQKQTNDVQWAFKDIDREEIKKIEIYKGYNHPDLHRTYSDQQEIGKFIEIFNDAEEDRSFMPETSEEDPDIYHLVFYTEGPIAATEVLFFGSDVWYWHPDDTAIISDEIERFIK